MTRARFSCGIGLSVRLAAIGTFIALACAFAPLFAQTSEIALGSSAQGAEGWKLNLGKEFAGARGILEERNEDAPSRDPSLVLTADFIGGGKYVSVDRRLSAPLDVKQFSFWLKADNLKQFGVRIIDSTGQMHQQRFALTSRRGWNKFVVTNLASPQHWFGADDGIWHGPALSISFLVERDSVVDASKHGSLSLSAVTARATSGVAIEPKQEPDISFELPRKPMYYWGKSDAPATATLVVSGSSGSFDIPSINLLDYHGKPLREIFKSATVARAGTPFRAEIDITPPAYGVFFLAADTATKKVRAPFAWVAEAAEPWPESPFGVQMHFAEGPSGKHQTLGGAGGALDLVRKMGASWIRDEIFWAEKPGGEPSIPMDSTNPYFYVEPAANRHLQLLVNINGVNQAYDDRQAPHSIQALGSFGRFASAAARSWGSSVHSWEIWNEPNIAPGWPGRKPDPAEYEALLKAGSAGIKAVDPHAMIVGGVCAGADLKYLSQLLDSGAAKYMDAISVHLYQTVAPELPSAKPNMVAGMGLPNPGHTFLGRLENLKTVLDRDHCGHLKVWLTEMACIPQDRGLSSDQIASQNTRAFLLALALPYVQRIFKYNFQDRGEAGSTHWDYLLGEILPNGAPKADFVAYNTMSRLLRKARFVRALSAGDQAYLYEFSTESGNVLAAWTSSGKKQIPMKTVGSKATLIDLMGNETAVFPESSGFNLDISEEPEFVRGAVELAASKNNR